MTPGQTSAAPRLAVITLFSEARLEHARNQFTQLALLTDGEPTVLVVAVWLDESPPPKIEGVTVLHLPPGVAGFRLARGRNAGATAAGDAGATGLVFLDAACL